MDSAPRRESQVGLGHSLQWGLGAKPLVGALISVGTSGFALGKGSLLGIAVDVRDEGALESRTSGYIILDVRNSRHQISDVKSTVECLS